MKIPETQGPYYPAEENGQWQGNGVVLESAVPSIAGGDAGYVPTMQPTYGPPHPPQGYIPMGPGGAYYTGFAPTHAPHAPHTHAHHHTPHTHTAAAPSEVFAEYMWMENQEQFDKEVMQQLEEDALMEECVEFMLEDEKREQMEGRINGHPNRGPPNGVQHVSAEQVSKSILNPLAAEFVPTRSAATAPSAPAPHVAPPAPQPTTAASQEEKSIEIKTAQESSEKELPEPTEKPADVETTPEVSAKEAPVEPPVPPASPPAPPSAPEPTVEVSALAQNKSTTETKPATANQAKKPTMADIVASKQAKAKSAESAKGATKTEAEPKKEAKSAKASTGTKDVKKSSDTKISVKAASSKTEVQKVTKTNESVASKVKVVFKGKPNADKKDKDSPAPTRQSSETKEKETTSADKQRKEGDGDSDLTNEIPVVSARSEKNPSPPTTVIPTPELNPSGPKPINYAAAARATKPAGKAAAPSEKPQASVVTKVASSEKSQATSSQRRGSAKK